MKWTIFFQQESDNIYFKVNVNICRRILYIRDTNVEIKKKFTLDSDEQTTIANYLWISRNWYAKCKMSDI